MDNVINELWSLIIKLIGQMERVWGWLSNDIKIETGWLKIPLILPNGLNLNLPFSLLDMFGIGIIAIIVLWVIKALVPLG